MVIFFFRNCDTNTSFYDCKQFFLKVKCEEVVKAYINRAREVNKVLNAIVEPRYDEALQEAQAVDKMLDLQEKSEQQIALETPLLGVPITIKESIAVEGNSFINYCD